MWPELHKARTNVREIEKELDRLVQNHNSFRKKEIARQHDTLVAETDAALERIEEEIGDMRANITNHKKQVSSKARFLKRHYKAL